jgi:hypothetical protein
MLEKPEMYSLFIADYGLNPLHLQTTSKNVAIPPVTKTFRKKIVLRKTYLLAMRDMIKAEEHMDPPYIKVRACCSSRCCWLHYYWMILHGLGPTDIHKMAVYMTRNSSNRCGATASSQH